MRKCHTDGKRSHFSPEYTEILIHGEVDRPEMMTPNRHSFNSCSFLCFFLLLCQAREHPDPASQPVDSWCLYQVCALRSQKLEMTERSETFSSKYDPTHHFHSTLIHMLQDDMSTDAIARTRESSYLFVDTVHSLLRATRPLMFS